MSYFVVAIGGAIGAMSRFWVYNAFLRWEQKSAYATLSVNVLGSLIIGIVFVLLTERALVNPEWRSLTTVGFLGAFTTFSTFSMDAIGMLEQGQLSTALLYILSSVVLCILAAWLGLQLTRQII